MSLLVVMVLLALLFRAGRDILAEGEHMVIELAERNLENLVWLEGKRAVAEEGVAGLERRAGGDPRAWSQDPLAALRPEEATVVPRFSAARERWTFDVARGELVYRVEWLEGGDRRWRVDVLRDGAESPTPGLARDLRLVRVGDKGTPP